MPDLQGRAHGCEAIMPTIEMILNLLDHDSRVVHRGEHRTGNEPHPPTQGKKDHAINSI